MAFTLRVPVIHHKELFSQKRSEEQSLRDKWSKAAKKYGACSPEARRQRELYEIFRGAPIGA